MGFFGRIFGNEYDRDFGPRRDWGNTGGNVARNWGYGAGVWGTPVRDQDRFGYDRGFHGSNMGYDRNFRGNWQTDYSDPFGDRSAHTPMRSMRGGSQHGYDRNYFGSGNDRNMMDTARDWVGGHRRHFEADTDRMQWGGPREGSWNRGYDRNFTPRRNGYDSGWF